MHWIIRVSFIVLVASVNVILLVRAVKFEITFMRMDLCLGIIFGIGMEKN